MLHRTCRSFAGALSLVCLLAVFGGMGMVTEARGAKDLNIDIEDIPSLAGKLSPQVRLAALGITNVDAERRLALIGSNPAVAYDHEESDAQREWQLTLRKRFERPLTRGKLQQAWDGRVRAAELHSEQTARDVVADLKAGYAELQLLETHLGRLQELNDLVELAADVAATRHAEGEISGLDRRLIRLTAYTVETAASQSRRRHVQALATWRSDLGLDPAQELILTTPIRFRPVDLEGLRLDTTLPGDRARQEMARALASQASAAQPGLLPGLDVYAGYKRFDPDLDGFVAGVALDLPLLDNGGAEAARLRAQRRLVEGSLTMERSRRREEIIALTSALKVVQPLLARYAAEIETESLPEALLVSYREGAISLDDLLGAIQIETAALDANLADLTAYFQNIFRLEALTGAGLIDFAHREDGNE